MNTESYQLRRAYEADAVNKGFVVRYDGNGSPVVVATGYNSTCSARYVIGDLDIQNQCIFTKCDGAESTSCVPSEYGIDIYGYQ